jgi:hypothetical protein
MDSNSILALAIKMKIERSQFNSFKFFVYSKYKNKIQSPDVELKLDSILKEIYHKLPSNSNVTKKINKPTQESAAKLNYKKLNSTVVNIKPNNTKQKPIKNKRKKKKKAIVNDKQKLNEPIIKPYKNKDNMSVEKSNILRLKTDYIRKPHTIIEFTDKLLWDENYFIDWLIDRGFKGIQPSSILKIEYIESLAEEIIQRRKKVVKWETEIVTKNRSKTKPNYFKLIYNSIGSRR